MTILFAWAFFVPAWYLTPLSPWAKGHPYPRQPSFQIHYRIQFDQPILNKNHFLPSCPRTDKLQEENPNRTSGLVLMVIFLNAMGQGRIEILIIRISGIRLK